jgi:chemotaxis protein MotB
MQKQAQVIFRVLSVAAASVLLSGCTNWQKKYKALDVEHQNLKGLYENCVASLDSSSAKQAELSQQLSQSQMTIEQLQKQKGSAADKTGFQVGEVSVDEKAGTITVTLENTILFASGSAKLKGATSSELDHIYSVIRERYSGRQIDVVGHTDTDPIRKTKDQWQDNWDLSAGRALTVLRYLTNKGIPGDRIRAVACGESRPVASNSTAAGKAKNRRVEIVVHMR